MLYISLVCCRFLWSNVWIGFHDASHSDESTEFTWLTGEVVGSNGFTNWRSGMYQKDTHMHKTVTNHVMGRVLQCCPWNAINFSMSLFVLRWRSRLKFCHCILDSETLKHGLCYGPSLVFCYSIQDVLVMDLRTVVTWVHGINGETCTVQQCSGTSVNLQVKWQQYSKVHFTVQYASRNLPLRMQSSVTHLLYNIFQHKLNQN